MLVAARQVADQGGAAAANVEVGNGLVQGPFLGRRVDQAAVEFRQRLQGQVVPQPLAQQQAARLAILGQVAQAKVLGLPGMVDADGLAEDVHIARGGAKAAQPLECLGPARSDQARDAQNLAPAQGEGDVLGKARHGQPPDLQCDLARRGQLVGEQIRHLPAHHGIGHRVLVHLRCLSGPDHAAVAHDGQVVGDFFHLVQLVGREQHRRSRLAQRADLAQQDRGFRPGQHGSGFVHHQNAGVAQQGLGDLNHLLVAVGQRGHDPVGRDAAFQPVQQFAGPHAHRGLVKKGAALQFPAQEDVLFHGQLFGQVEFLVDHRDPPVLGLAHVGEGHGLAVQQNLTGRRRLIARHDLHGRGLARAVFADQRMDPAGAQGDVHPMQHLDRAEAAADIAQGKHGHGVTQAASSRADRMQASMKRIPANPSSSPGRMSSTGSRCPACAARIACAAPV